MIIIITTTTKTTTTTIIIIIIIIVIIITPGYLQLIGMEAIDVRTWKGYPRGKSEDKIASKPSDSDSDSDSGGDDVSAVSQIRRLILSYLPFIIVIFVIIKGCEFLLQEAIADEASGKDEH